jgi:hypothetical protein
MKISVFTLFYILILSFLLKKGFCESMSFLEGRYIYWFVLLIVSAFVSILRSGDRNIKINLYDGLLLLLTILGMFNFIFLSKATLYSLSIWNYTGYLVAYILLRNVLNTEELIQKALSILLYFCSITAFINVILVFLQGQHWVTSSNEFFVTTGMFYSPNQLGIYLSIGCLSTLFLLEKAKLKWKKISLGFILPFLFIGLFYTESRGAYISLFVALSYYFYVSKAKIMSFLNWKNLLFVAIIATGSLYYIVHISNSKSDSTSGRLFALQQVTKQIMQKPIGYGINSFSTEYNKAKALYFENNNNWQEIKNGGYLYYPNNDVLELTFELGIAWILVFIGFLFLLFKNSRIQTIETNIARTILLCLLIFSFTNSIFIIPIFVIIACICAVTIINTKKIKGFYEFKNSGTYKFIGIGLLVFFSFVFVNRINADNKLYKLAHDKMYLKGVNQLQEYVSKTENKGEEYFMAGIILMNNNYYDEGVSYMQTGFDLSGKPSLGKILAGFLQKKGNFKSAENIFKYNKNVEPYRYEARMDLFHLYLESTQIEKAKEIALEIINFPVKIKSKEIDEFKKEAENYLKKNKHLIKLPNHKDFKIKKSEV